MPVPKTLPRFGWLLLAIVLLAGCATPIGIREVAPHDSYRESMANPLTEGVTSNATNIVLRRFDLAKEYERSPAGVIEYLHDEALRDDRRDTLYALAELSYLYGERLGKSLEPADQELAPDYFLLASIYAYHFLLDDRLEPPPNAFDIRARTACDLYNFALWRGLATGQAGALNFVPAVRKLPIGALAISVESGPIPLVARGVRTLRAGGQVCDPRGVHSQPLKGDRQCPDWREEGEPGVTFPQAAR